MKLRGRRKEAEDQHCSLCYRPARPRPEPMLRLLPSSSPLSPSTQPHQPAPPPFQFLLRHGSGEQCPPAIPPPAVPPLPFFFIKLLKQQSVEGRTVAGAQLADPAVLFNDNRARPARPRPCPFIQSGGRGFSPVPMAPSLWRVEP